MENRHSAALLALSLSFLCADAFAAVGRTAGHFNVTSTGAAQYTIPIWAPPGPRSIQPNLSLVYNSQAGIGPLGVGWAISGLGAITRCNQTLAQNGTPAPVALAISDSYCLNGNLLRLTNGTYGTANSTYQTEIADFSNITAVGSAGQGPASWTVQGRDGLTYEYGSTDTNGNGVHSQVLATGTTTASTWLLSKVIDRAGNNLVINYTLETGTAVPYKILWTPTTHGAATYTYTMLFNYTTNVVQSTPTKYIGGTLVSNTALLSSIEILSGSTVLKDYFLAYQTSPTTSRYELKTVTECADSAESNCLPATTVTYQGLAAGVSATTTTALSSSGSFLTTCYDLNGDGYPDLVYYNGTSWWVSFGSKTGYEAPINTGITTLPLLIGKITTGTKDGFLAKNGAMWWYYLWNGTSFAGTSTGLAVDTTASQFVLADIDGDGRADLVTMNEVNVTTKGLGYTVYQATLTTRLNTSSGSTASFSSTLTTAFTTQASEIDLIGPGSPYGMLRRFDFNGDGRDDLAICTVVPIGCEELISTGSTFTGVTIPQGSYLSIGLYFVNFNDDACTDFVDGSTLYISGCNGTVPTTYPLIGTAVAAMDWDGDGRTDLVVQNGTTLGVYLSTGSGISPLLPTAVPYTSTCSYVVMGTRGDGLDDLGCWSTTASSAVTYYSHTGAGEPPDLMTNVSDGYGNSASPTYLSLTSATNFTQSSNAAYPYQNYVGPLYEVYDVVFSDPSNRPTGTYYNQFSYTGAWTNLQGRGFSGFEYIQKYDSRNGLWEERGYNPTFPYTGMLATDVLAQDQLNTKPIKNLTNTLASVTLNANANEERYFPYIASAVKQRYELGGTDNGLLIATAATTYSTPDDYGNFATVTTTTTDNDAGSPYVGDTWTTTTTNTVAPNTGTWCLNLPTETQVTKSSTAPGGAAITRTVNYTPDYANCRQTQRVTATGTAYQVTEAYGYDTTFGNLLTDSITGSGMAARVTTVSWNSTGQFPQTVQNPLLQTITLGFDPNTGLQISQSDPNSTTASPVVTSWGYDAFHRKTSELRPDGTLTTWAYNACSTNGCVNANNQMTVVQTRVNTDGSTLRIDNTYLDSIDRTLVTSGQMLSGAYDRNEVQYDSLGRVHLQGIPCTFVSCAQYWITNTYDALNRLTQSQRPISSTNSTPQTTSYSYHGRTSTVTDPQSKVTTKIALVTGKPARTMDPNGYFINFNRDAFGSLLSTTDSLSNTLTTKTYQYGIQPFVVSSTDKDLGNGTYTVDALGEVTEYTDAKSQSFSTTYDALSRPTSRTEPDLTTTWTWGNTAANYNIGKLASVTAASSLGTYQEVYTFDALTRPSKTVITIPGDQSYTYTSSYNPATGLLSTLTYPQSTSGYGLTLDYTVTKGILSAVTDASAGTVYWSANTGNPRGQITAETLGNGVVTNRTFDAVTGWLGSIGAGVGPGTTTLQNSAYLYDEIGNLTQRQDNNLGLTENFYYDDDYRLSSSTLNGTQNLSLTYAANGNIATRSDLGGGTAWTYDPVHIHAVTQAGTGGYSFVYDANGNAISRNGYINTWTSYNYPSGVNSAGESAIFYYGPNRQRIETIYSGSIGTETTYHVGRLLEKVANANGSGITDWRYYIQAGSELVGIYSTQAAAMRYATSDPQGGIATLSGGSDPCAAGYTLSGSTCTETLSEPATATDSCPSGYTLSGSSCLDPVSVAATTTYSCPAGYSRSGTTCSETVTVAATVTYSCPAGYSRSGTTCSETQSEAALTSCPLVTRGAAASVPQGTLAQCTYYCLAGFTLSGKTCYETLTQPATATYSCPAGYALSGSTCSKMLTQAASASYSCPAGYTLSGSTCSETLTVSATVSYSCPVGYTLSGTTCSETLSVAATGAGVGALVAESFTAFGNRRSGETWSAAPSSIDETTINGVSREGYTGQTALGVSMGLNHMNGRVQDAITGRFLSPDPHIPDPTNAQSYNRYSYVINNPLTRVDPSGFEDLPHVIDGGDGDGGDGDGGDAGGPGADSDPGPVDGPGGDNSNPPQPPPDPDQPQLPEITVNCCTPTPPPYVQTPTLTNLLPPIIFGGGGGKNGAPAQSQQQPQQPQTPCYASRSFNPSTASNTRTGATVGWVVGAAAVLAANFFGAPEVEIAEGTILLEGGGTVATVATAGSGFGNFLGAVSALGDSSLVAANVGGVTAATGALTFAAGTAPICLGQGH